MNERRIIGGQIGPEESILQLKPHYARRISVDLGDEELSRRYLSLDPARCQLAFLPHDDAKRIHPSCGFPQHVLHDTCISRVRLA